MWVYSVVEHFLFKVTLLSPPAWLMPVKLTVFYDNKWQMLKQLVILLVCVFVCVFIICLYVYITRSVCVNGRVACCVCVLTCVRISVYVYLRSVHWKWRLRCQQVWDLNQQTIVMWLSLTPFIFLYLTVHPSYFHHCSYLYPVSSSENTHFTNTKIIG